MKFWKRLKNDEQSSKKSLERAILVFSNTSEVIRAEEVLKKRGLDVKVKGPPPSLQTGCDMIIEFPMLRQMEVLSALSNAKLVPLQILAIEGELLEPVSLFRVKDFGKYVMIRAANMKITVEKATGTIVNISGGGCPDVPYLAEVFIGRNLLDGLEPKDVGSTLCGYALQLAFEEAKRTCAG